MSRTPLMRALQRLAGEHRAATQLGIEVEEYRERQAEARISRRELVKRSGAVGAAVVLGGPMVLARSARAAGASRIAIIGGGIAGLTAALTLQDKGVYCDVYESSGRVGGRMHSTGSGFWANGQVRRALRRADRQQPQDDPPARPALQARRRSTCSGAAERHRGHLLVLRRRLPVRQADRRFQAGPQHAAGQCRRRATRRSRQIHRRRAVLSTA